MQLASFNIIFNSFIKNSFMKSLVFYNINFMLSSTSKAILNKSNSIVKKFLMAASTTNMQRICKSSSQKSLIAVCQMTATSDKERNLRTVLEFIESGKEKGAKVSQFDFWQLLYFYISNHIISLYTCQLRQVTTVHIRYFLNSIYTKTCCAYS